VPPRSQQRARPRVRSLLAGLAGLAVAGVAGVALVGADVTAAVGAAPAQTTFAAESFSGSDVGDGFVLPSTTAAFGNVACLTARPTTGTNTGSIPNCASTSDADGSGALRLTDAGQVQAGGVGAKQSIPMSKGLDASFTSYQYNGNGADGIVFYLAATDPYNPAVPDRLGYLGGALGYASYAQGGVEGLPHGYLGIGLDAYGSFSAGTDGCPGAVDQGQHPNSVTVRGPGNGYSGYCVQSATDVPGGLRPTAFTSRATAAVPVEVVVNPTASAITARQNTSVSVPAGQYAIIVTGIGADEPVVVTGALPRLTGANAAGIDPSWIDPATGYPYKLTYGWTAGTGGAYDVHEVSDLLATTAAGPVPVLTARTGGATRVDHAGSGTYTVTPTVSADGGFESEPVRTTTTFPTDVTPSAVATPGDGWTCTVSGQVVSCQQAAAERVPGAALPALSLPYTVAGAARTATISTVVSSTDAEAVTATREIAVAPQATTVTVSDVDVTVGTDATLGATVASAEATGATVPTGTVRFSETATGAELCTAVLVDGSATCTVPTSTAGRTAVTAAYLGDTDHAPSTGSGTLVVSKVASPITLSSSVAAPDSVVAGQPVTLSVDGLGQPTGPEPAPTGTIEFREAGTVLCTVTLPTTSCDVTSLAVGSHGITARYSGDDLHAAATSDAVVVTVRAAATTPGAAPSTPPAAGTDPTTSPSPAAAPTTPAATGLAFTGSTVAVGTGAALAAALLLAGLVLLVVRRSRAARGTAE
jgi:hypothetical protein